MNAKETYDFLEERLTSPSSRHREAAGYELVICTSEPHLSGGGIVKIKAMHVGFDWYEGKILITPERELIPKELNRDIPKKPGTIPGSYGTNYIVCINCCHSVKKTYNYCPKCGQKLDWEK